MRILGTLAVLALSTSMLGAAPATMQFMEPTLIGGRPADPQEWMASVYASMSGSRCTATVVGPRTLFIAAHCVSNGGTASFSVGPNQYTSKCTHSPNYRGNATADWALCLINREVTGIKYENVATDPSVIAVGNEILLTGYGCVRDGGGGGNDGVYRIGEAKVVRLPSGTNNDIVSSSGAALCFGDSGGPAFKYLDTAKSKRVMISVNSRGQIKLGRESYLSAVYSAQAKSFIQSWKTSTAQKICGIDTDAPECRDAGPTPPPPDDKCKLQVDAFAKAKTELDVQFKNLGDCLAK